MEDRIYIDPFRYGHTKLQLRTIIYYGVGSCSVSRLTFVIMTSAKYAKLQQLDTDGRIIFDGLAAPNSSNFTDKCVIVTGGCSGLGAACVRMFAEVSAYVVIFDRDEERGKSLEEELGYKRVTNRFDSDTSLYSKSVKR